MITRRAFLAVSGLFVSWLAMVRLSLGKPKRPHPTRTPRPTATATHTPLRTIRYGEGVLYGTALYGEQRG